MRQNIALSGRQCPPTTIWNEPGADHYPTIPAARRLHKNMESLLSSSLSKSSRLLYNNHWQSFVKFMRKTLKSSPLPATSYHVSLFITHLHLKKLKCSSIRRYLSAIAFTHKLHGHIDSSDCFRIKKLLLALKKKTNRTGGRRAITKALLHKIISTPPTLNISRYYQKLFKCLFLIMYFACLRISEVATVRHSSHTVQSKNVRMINGMLCIRLDSYKHSNQQSSKILLQPTFDKLCPITAYRSFLKSRRNHSGPLFIMRRGKGISRDRVALTLKKCLELADIAPKKFNTYSFRIGRITDLALLGTSYSRIQTIGRFKSNAFQQYIKPSAITVT